VLVASIRRCGKTTIWWLSWAFFARIEATFRWTSGYSATRHFLPPYLCGAVLRIIIMSIPKPGKPVRGSKSGAPLMALFDLLGRRWAMGIIWQLNDGSQPFNELQKRCNSISPTILSARIKDLLEATLIERTLDGYKLTPIGNELINILKPFKELAQKWTKKLKE
jgi:DNA-binding HxlR family transcriptional regulator